MSQLDVKQFSELLGNIYEAGVNSSKWKNALIKLDAIIDGAHLSLYGHDTRSNLSLGMLSTRYSDEFLESYDKCYCQTNLFTPVVLKIPVMEARLSEECVPRDLLLKSEFYNDWLRPQEDVGTGGGAVIINEHGRLLILSGQVRFSDEEDKVPLLMDAVKLLMPHVKRAFEIQRMLNGQKLDDRLYRKRWTR